MTITSNKTLVRIFLTSDVEVKKLKKKRYLIKVTLDNGMIVQLNDVPFEVNNEFIDFKLNNSNQMIAKQLVDTANAVLVKTPSSVIIKTEDKQEDIIMNNEINKTNTEATNQINEKEIIMENNELFNQVKEIVSRNKYFQEYFKLENIDIDLAVTNLILPLKEALKHVTDENIKKSMVDAFLKSISQENDKEREELLEEIQVVNAALDEKIVKIPETMETNRQGIEQLKTSCEKLSQEVNKPEEAKIFCDNKTEESTLYSVAKTVGKVAGVAALGVVGFLAYGFIKSKLD